MNERDFARASPGPAVARFKGPTGRMLVGVAPAATQE